MTNIFKLSLLLASPLLFAYGNGSDLNDGGIEFSAEVYGGTVDTSFTVEPVGTVDLAGHQGQEAADIFSLMVANFKIAMHEAPDKYPKFAFGARFLANMKFRENMRGAVYIGAETTNDADFVDYDGIETDGTATKSVVNIKANYAITPGAYIMFEHLGLGIQYDMREYDFGLKRDDTTIGDKSNNTVLFGVRAENQYQYNDTEANIYFEYFSSMGQKSDSEMSDGLIDLILNFEGDAEGAEEVTYPSTYTHIYKARLGLSFNLTDM